MEFSAELDKALVYFQKVTVIKTARYPDIEFAPGLNRGNPTYCAMGLVTEVWEVIQEKDADKQRIEMGDCLWYCAALCNEYKFNLKVMIESGAELAQGLNLEEPIEYALLGQSIKILDAHKKIMRGDGLYKIWVMSNDALAVCCYLVAKWFGSEDVLIKTMKDIEDKLMARSKA